MCTMCVPIWVPGTGVTDSYMPWCGCHIMRNKAKNKTMRKGQEYKRTPELFLSHSQSIYNTLRIILGRLTGQVERRNACVGNKRMRECFKKCDYKMEEWETE